MPLEDVNSLLKRNLTVSGGIVGLAVEVGIVGLIFLEYAVEAFQDRLTDYEVSKGMIRLSYQKNLPLELIADIVK